MGWSGGSGPFAVVIMVIKEAFPGNEFEPWNKRKDIYDKIYEQFKYLDWDTEGECKGMDSAFDALMYVKGVFRDEDEDEEQYE